MLWRVRGTEYNAAASHRAKLSKASKSGATRSHYRKKRAKSSEETVDEEHGAALEKRLLPVEIVDEVERQHDLARPIF